MSNKTASIPSTNQATSFIHCSQCVRDLPPGKSPQDHARLSVGMTPIGLQVWCVRHDINIAHIEFGTPEVRMNVAKNGEQIRTITIGEARCDRCASGAPHRH